MKGLLKIKENSFRTHISLDFDIDLPLQNILKDSDQESAVKDSIEFIKPQQALFGAVGESSGSNQTTVEHNPIKLMIAEIIVILTMIFICSCLAKHQNGDDPKA